MSSKSLLTKSILSLSCFVAIIGYSYSKSMLMNQPSGVLKSPQKKAFLTESRTHGLKTTKKLSNSLQLKIHKERRETFSAGKPFRLVGSVVIQQNASELKLTWGVSDKVRIVAGERETLISNVKSGERYIVPITILTDNEKNEQIHLQASARLGSIRFSNATMYNTVLQKKIEEDIKSLEFRGRKFSRSKRMQRRNRKSQKGL